jgi:hypothetical protein
MVGYSRFNKKADTIIDWIVIISLLFVGTLIFVMVWVMMGHINDAFKENPAILNESKNEIDKFYTKQNHWQDFVWIFLFIGCWMASMIFAYYIDSHPVFFVISLLLMVFVFIYAAVISNTYAQLVASDAMASNNIAAAFPMMNFILNHLVESIIVVIFSVCIVLYGKFSTSGGGVY